MTGQATCVQLVGLSIVLTFVVFSGAQPSRAPRARWATPQAQYE